MLKVTDLESGYGPMQVLWKVSLEVQAGTITALLGPNGVGKSTTLMTILGSIKPWGGTIYFKSQDVTYLPSHKKVALGLTLVPEGKHIFPSGTPTKISSALGLIQDLGLFDVSEEKAKLTVNGKDVLDRVLGTEGSMKSG